MQRECEISFGGAPVSHGYVIFVPRATIGHDVWDDYVLKHQDGWLWHTHSWIAYCLAYKGGADHSFAVATQDGKLVGIVPLIVEGTQFSMGGNPTVQMLLTQGLQPCVEHIIKRIEVVAHLAGVRISESMCWLTRPAEAELATIPADLLSPINQREVTFGRRMVTLTEPKEQRWACVRKSYKQFIRQGQAKYDINKRTPEESYQVFLAMHDEFYGHCRPRKTYEIQQELCQKGFGRAYLATNDDGFNEGGILWYVYKGIAFYASGVYPQDNVSQYLIWASMCELATEGIQYADLGYQGRAKNEKEKNIEFTKRGFGGIDWPVPCVETIFTNNEEGVA